MKSRQYTTLDRGIMAFNSFLSYLPKAENKIGDRLYPAKEHVDIKMDENTKKHVSGLMRINHAGEIAAQALYKAQALTASDDELKKLCRSLQMKKLTI